LPPPGPNLPTCPPIYEDSGCDPGSPKNDLLQQAAEFGSWIAQAVAEASIARGQRDVALLVRSETSARKVTRLPPSCESWAGPAWASYGMSKRTEHGVVVMEHPGGNTVLPRSLFCLAPSACSEQFPGTASMIAGNGIANNFQGRAVAEDSRRVGLGRIGSESRDALYFLA